MYFRAMFFTQRQATEKIAALESRISELDADFAQAQAAAEAAKQAEASAAQLLAEREAHIAEQDNSLEASANKIAELTAELDAANAAIAEAEASAAKEVARQLAAAGQPVIAGASNEPGSNPDFPRTKEEFLSRYAQIKATDPGQATTFFRAHEKRLNL